ncbi:hypothetical protein DH09_06670 [Bacillaceae bacterium JMAK1]|nr:hypothetical protein DH09_06670 [Bacillaceae bacterium JMAK1]
METLTVNTTHQSYPIILGEQLLQEAETVFERIYGSKKKRLFVITDTTVAPLYLDQLKENLKSHQIVGTFVIPAGEGSKSFEMYNQAMTSMLEAKLDRASVVIALGGGVVGDLAGFLSSTYMRGISFVQIPTTLLAHDSSVGGKTGINHPLGKNLIGAFHQPDAVVYDLSLLRSLPEREWRSGYGEVLKHGYIGDQDLLSCVQNSTITNITTSVLRKSIAVKAKIVEEDEREKGVRAYLNFGHTMAHALEQVSGYGVVTHGEAVVNGMLFSLFLSKQFHPSLPIQVEDERKRLEKLGYSFAPLETMDVEKIITSMLTDKKNSDSKIADVILEDSQKPRVILLDKNKFEAYLYQFKGELFS